jgi:hypothetical protein
MNMTGNEIDVYRSASIDQRIRYATLIADARGLLPDGIHSPAHALLIFEQAAALGIPPITGLSQIHIIKGKPTMSAGLMSGLIRQAGHKLRVWVEGNVEDETLVARAELIRADDPDFTFKVEFSIKDARRAGLFPGKADSNWQKWPRSMVKARATSEIAREGATDVFLGSIYTPEELDPNIEVDEQGEMVSAPAPQMTNLSSETTQSSTITAATDAMPLEVRRQWFEAAGKLKKHAALLAMYEDAKAKGILSISLADDPDNPDELELGQYLIAKGRQAASEEGVSKDEPRANPETGEVEEEDVVDAEIVEDEGPAAVLDPEVVAESPSAAPAKTRTATRSRKPANAPEAGA